MIRKDVFFLKNGVFMIFPIIAKVLLLADEYLKKHEANHAKRHIWMQTKDHRADFNDLNNKMRTIFTETREGLKHIEGFVNEKENRFRGRSYLTKEIKTEGKAAFKEIRSKIEQVKRKLDLVA